MSDTLRENLYALADKMGWLCPGAAAWAVVRQPKTVDKWKVKFVSEVLALIALTEGERAKMVRMESHFLSCAKHMGSDPEVRAMYISYADLCSRLLSEPEGGER